MSIYIIGAGGHGKIVLDVLKARRELFSGDPAVMPIPELYTDKIYFADRDSQLAGKYLNGHEILYMKTQVLQDVSFFFVAIGDNKDRKRIYDELKLQDYPTGALASPFAYVSPEAAIGDGTLINHGAIIQPGTLIGENCIINTRVSIDHDSKISSHVHIAPGCLLCGNIIIGDGTFIGAGSVVKPGITIGKNCFVRMGSVITSDVPDNTRI